MHEGVRVINNRWITQPDIEKEVEKDLEKLGSFQAILSTVSAKPKPL